MDPIPVIIWTCVAIFIITAILTLLHVSGIRSLPNPEHGKMLFKALILEIVIVAVAAFSSHLIGGKEIKHKIIGSGMVGNKIENSGIDLPGTVGKTSGNLEETSLLRPSAEQDHKLPAKIKETEKKNCREITIIDASTIPPTSKIETVCE